MILILKVLLDHKNFSTENDDEYRRLSQSKAELSVRLRDLQSKKDHLDTLLMQLQSLRDLRSAHNPMEPNGALEPSRMPLGLPETGEDRDSTSSSLAQMGGALQIGQDAGDTAVEAEETLRLLDAQKKLIKLKQVSFSERGT